MKKTTHPLKPLDTDTIIQERDGTTNTFLYGAINVTFEYYAAITLGSSEQVFTVQMDTGSSSMAIPSVNCWQYDDSNTAIAMCSHADNYYDMKDSKNAKEITCEDNPNCRCLTSGKCGFSLGYGDGSFLQGSLIQDDFTLGGLSTQVMFGEILAESQGFSGTTVDGILGLGYSSLDPIDGDSVFEKLVEASKCDNSFSMCLGPNGGIFTLGGVDNSYSDGEMLFTPITTESFYVVEMEDVIVGNTSINVPKWVYNENYTIVDSGTTLLLLNNIAYEGLVETFAKYCPDEFKEVCDYEHGYQNSIFSGTCYSFTEEDIAQFPNISFSLNGTGLLNITPQQYFLRIQNGFCFGIQPVDEIGAILGDVFMQAFNVFFDRANKRVGFAPVKNCDGFELSLDINDGDNQIGSLFWNFKKPLSVSVKYENGLPAVGILVKFEGDSAKFNDGGMSITNEEGIAYMSVSFSRAGKHSVNATLLNFNGEVVMFQLQTTVYAIVGITIGVALFLAIVIFISVIVYRKRKYRQHRNSYREESSSASELLLANE